jgi:mannitol-specific phosphotransferase system IIBC component
MALAAWARSITRAGLLPLTELPSSAQLVVAHRSLLARLKEVAPEAQIHAVVEFLNAAVYEQLIKELRRTGDQR